MQTAKAFSQLIPLTPSDAPVPFPTPPGPYKVGTLSLEATDTSRLDPFGFIPHHRRLMFSFFYPTTTPEDHPFATYMPSARLASDFDEIDHFPSGTTARYQPQAYSGAPVHSPGSPLPVILFSTGFGVLREHYTIMLQNLASEGYFCVSIGHTYDTAIHFPDGETVWQIGRTGEDPELSTRVRAEDALFSLSQLADVAFCKQIPGLAPEMLDLSRVGMLGHSLGGAAALEAMVMDERIKGGVNLDGAFQGEQMTVGTERPFLVISAPKEKGEEDSTLGKTWEHLRGWKAALEIEGAVHMSFADCCTYLKLLDVLDLVDPKRKLWGTIDPLRMMVVQSTYLKAFFDFVLRGGSDHIFKSPDQAFPEVKICFREEG
jgi:dienelactone hydrolase